MDEQFNLSLAEGGDGRDEPATELRHIQAATGRRRRIGKRFAAYVQVGVTGGLVYFGRYLSQAFIKLRFTESSR